MQGVDSKVKVVGKTSFSANLRDLVLPRRRLVVLLISHTQEPSCPIHLRDKKYRQMYRKLTRRLDAFHHS